MAFRVGMKVTCIDDVFWSGRDPRCNYPVKGDIYTIRSFDHNRPGCESPVGLRLEEIINPILPYPGGDDETSFPPWRFRPLIERKTDTGMAILRKLLDGNKIEERV